MKAIAEFLPTVLVIEDDRELRDSLRHVLEDDGFATLGAADGKKGLEILRTPESPAPSVIVLDLRMPVMTGWDFLDALQRDRALAAIPVIAVTGIAAIAKDARVTEVLRKPVQLDRLLVAVRSACGVEDEGARSAHGEPPDPD